MRRIGRSPAKTLIVARSPAPIQPSAPAPSVAQARRRGPFTRTSDSAPAVTTGIAPARPKRVSFRARTSRSGVADPRRRPAPKSMSTGSAGNGVYVDRRPILTTWSTSLFQNSASHQADGDTHGLGTSATDDDGAAARSQWR